MIQNLKIDIIYYDTPSDFEFEFNLGGCCHSRVLNTRTSSPKEMIGSLSKAVSRSRVILIIGKLDGTDGLFNLISKAIGLPLKQVDAEEYGIVPGTDTTVIADALPLVSTDGLLAGCIIESGPQSIIILPGEKALRKDIAENLVFQYITAVSRTPDTETVVTSDSAETEQPAAAEEAVPDVETETAENEIQTDVVEEMQKEADEEENFLQQEIFGEQTDEFAAEEVFEEITAPEIEINVPNEEQTKEETNEEHFIDIYAESETDSETAVLDSNYVYNTYSENEADNKYDDYDEDEEDDYDGEKKPSSGINTFIWIILGLMFIIAAVLVYMLVYTPLKGGANVIEYIGQVLNI